MLELRARRLLRFVQKQTRYKTLPCDQTSHHAIDRARRRLGLVLHRRPRTGFCLSGFCSNRILCNGDEGLAFESILCQITQYDPDVLEPLIELAVEIAREGREGRRVGTLFTVAA